MTYQFEEFDGQDEDFFGKPPRDDFHVRMAEGIVNDQHELRRLRRENAELLEYRDKYMDLLRSSTNHSRDMMMGLLQVAMTPGVLDAMAASNAEKETSK